MIRSIEELIASRDKIFVTIQRLLCDLEYRKKLIKIDFNLTEDEREEETSKINTTYNYRMYRYYRLQKFLEDTIAKIEYVEWNESLQNQINQLISDKV